MVKPLLHNIIFLVSGSVSNTDSSPTVFDYVFILGLLPLLIPTEYCASILLQIRGVFIYLFIYLLIHRIKDKKTDQIAKWKFLSNVLIFYIEPWGI